MFGLPMTALSQAHAQEIQAEPPKSKTTTRISIPTSSATTLVKEGDKKLLLVRDYISSTRYIDSPQKKSEVSNQGFYPYGGDTQDTNLESDTDRGFTSHRRLKDTGVYNAGARVYSPELGAFIQPDKVEGPNRYAYAENNPISNFDPSGKSCQGFAQRCSNGVNTSLSILGYVDDSPRGDFPFEAITPLINALKLYPPVAVVYGAVEAYLGESVTSGRKLGPVERIITGVGALLGGSYMANKTGGAINSAVQAARVNKLGGAGILAANSADEALAAARAANTGAYIGTIDEFRYMNRAQLPMMEIPHPRFNTPLNPQEQWVAKNLSDGGGLRGFYTFRNANRPQGVLNGIHDLEIIRHESIHMLQDYGGHAYGATPSTRNLFDIELMAYTTTDPGLRNSTLLQQVGMALRSVFGYEKYSEPVGRLNAFVSSAENAFLLVPATGAVNGGK